MDPFHNCDHASISTSRHDITLQEALDKLGNLSRVVTIDHGGCLPSCRLEEENGSSNFTSHINDFNNVKNESPKPIVFCDTLLLAEQVKYLTADF